MLLENTKKCGHFLLPYLDPFQTNVLLTGNHSTNFQSESVD